MNGDMEAPTLLNEMTDEQLCRLAILTMYGKIFPGKQPDREKLALYSVLLEPMTAQTLSASLQKLVMTQSVWPSIAEISSAAERLQETRENQRTPTYEEAWHEVIREMNDAFIYREPRFSTPTIRRVVQDMGWRALCEVTPDKLPTVRAQFRDFYTAAVERERDERQNQAILDSAEKTANLLMRGNIGISWDESPQIEEQAR